MPARGFLAVFPPQGEPSGVSAPVQGNCVPAAPAYDAPRTERPVVRWESV